MLSNHFTTYIEIEHLFVCIRATVLSLLNCLYSFSFFSLCFGLLIFTSRFVESLMSWKGQIFEHLPHLVLLLSSNDSVLFFIS